MKKRFLLFCIILFTLVTVFVVSENRSDYETALEKYNNKENDQALILFEKFIGENPKSIKSDDATWYMGRLYKRLDDDIKAALYFKKVLSDESSNRYEEAAYDLGKIFYYDKQYSGAIELLEFLDVVDELNSYHQKGLELLSRALYRLAYREKLEYREVESINLFNRSLSGYERLEPLLSDEEDLSRIHYEMAKIHNNLSHLTYTVETYENHIAESLTYALLALPMIAESDRENAEKLILKLIGNQKVGFNGRLVAFGGLDNLSASTVGADIYAKAALNIPAAGRSSLELGVSFHHHSFDFVASNFDKTGKNTDEWLVQYTEVLGADFSWRSGTRRNIYNKVNLFGDFQFAEDTRDNYISTGISDTGSVRFNKKWRFLWDSEFEWRTYPNYLIDNRKLDHLKVSFTPEIRFYALDWLAVSLIYGFDIKQYLDSKYHTDVLATVSTLDKMNLYNSGEIVFDADVGKIYNPQFSYNFNYLKTFNYNYVVTESSGDDFVEGYYDNLSHTFSFDNNFQLGDRLKIYLDSSLSLTNFINYIARDATDTYLPNNELRKDITVHLDLGVDFVFWTSPKGLELEGKLAGWWDYKSSNMTYNTTFDTNYSFAGVKLGVSVKLP